MIFVLDNYDSFTYNLVHLLGARGVETVVERNREISVPVIMALRPEGILLSPGPSRPENAGCLLDLIKAAAGTIPMMGVCLGHQAIGHAFGAKVVSAKRIMHGKLLQSATMGRDFSRAFHKTSRQCATTRWRWMKTPFQIACKSRHAPRTAKSWACATRNCP